jgi:hypothetical protein
LCRPVRRPKLVCPFRLLRHGGKPLAKIPPWYGIVGPAFSTWIACWFTAFSSRCIGDDDTTIGPREKVVAAMASASVRIQGWSNIAEEETPRTRQGHSLIVTCACIQNSCRRLRISGTSLAWTAQRQGWWGIDREKSTTWSIDAKQRKRWPSRQMARPNWKRVPTRLHYPSGW